MSLDSTRRRKIGSEMPVPTDQSSSSKPMSAPLMIKPALAQERVTDADVHRRPQPVIGVRVANCTSSARPVPKPSVRFHA